VPLGRGPAGEPSQRAFAFAEDGSRAAWLRERPGSGRGTFELVSLELDRSGAAPALIRDSLDVVHELVLSPDGRRAALLAGRVLEVVDASTGEAAAARDLPDWRVPRSLYFAPDGHLRLYPRSRLDPPASPAQDLLELDPATGELIATGRVPVESPGTLFRPAAAGDVAILLDGSRSRVSLCDAQTGEERAVLPPAGELRGAGFLAGGRIAAAYRAAGGGTTVRIFTRDARIEAAMDLPSPPAAVAILGEAAPGRVVLASNPVGANSTGRWTVSLLDVPGRRILQSWPGYAPLDPLAFWIAPALAAALGSRDGSSRAPVLFRSPVGGLARFDPMNGSLRAVSLSNGR
jgi:hypothetical protein